MVVDDSGIEVSGGPLLRALALDDFSKIEIDHHEIERREGEVWRCFELDEVTILRKNAGWMSSKLLFPSGCR
ncbi:MAG: hypothetical protein ACI9NQ_001406 [Paracoccaceae bacterium]